MGHDLLVEQSERPTGPYVTTYYRGTRTYDFDALSETSELTVAGLVYGSREFKRNISIDKGNGRSSTPIENALSYQRLALGPERILLLASAAPDLSLEKDVEFNGARHWVLRFRWGSNPVRLFLKKDTCAPSGFEITRPLPLPWAVWGDVPITTRWTSWQVLESGLMEPSQFSMNINGYPVSDETVISHQVTMSPGEAVMAPPIAPAKEDPASMLARYKAVPAAEGITQFQGPFNTFVVEQPDGLVVIEPVLSPAFASAFLQRLAKDWPGKRVKAVVATDDAWLHFGGIRSFTAQGARLYILDLNQPLVQRFHEAKHITFPDDLALHPAKPKFTLVRRPVTIGTGPTRMVLYPIAGQGSERMMMAYFPAHRLLYGSDLLQKQGDGFFFPAYPKELAEAVRRERLDVQSIFAEHLGPTPWKMVTDFLEKLAAKN